MINLLKKKTEDTEKTEEKKTLTKKQMVAIFAVIVAVIIAIVIVICNRDAGDITITAQSLLKEIKETSELSTVEYTYNSIVEVSNEKEIEYYVSYKGKVKAGFDFEKLEVTENKKTKQLIVTIPEIKITDVSVEDELDYIFFKEKYDTEHTYVSAREKCIKDLTKKANENSTVWKMASESAVVTVTALTNPFKQGLPEGWDISIVLADNTENKGE